MAYKIDVLGCIEEIEVNGLKDLQQAVGGLIQVAGEVEYSGTKYTVLVDEEGLFKQPVVMNLWAKLEHGIDVAGVVLLVTDKEFN